MSFEVSAEAYGRFMGRFSEPLAAGFCSLVPLEAGQRALDVGAGPGALTVRLVERLGAGSVAAVDPSPPFVAALRERCPAVDVRTAGIGDLPWPDGTFDAAFAQLVLPFVPDAVAGLREMARVTRPGGWVAACVWDHGGEGSPLATFWRAVRDVDPGSANESLLAGVREGQLGRLADEAGLGQVEQSSLVVRSGFADVEEWWQPYTYGIGPAGTYVAGLDPAARERLRARCVELLPEGPFEVSARAWSVVARVPAAG